MHQAYAGTHKGETGLVIANGPSLDDVPFGLLNKYVKVACNHYGCACEHNAFLPQPEYWSQTGLNQVQTAEQRKHYHPAIEGARLAFVNKYVVKAFPQDNVVGILSRKAQGIPTNDNQAFSKDPLHAVGIGFTQTYINLQIAYWLGFETVLIVGLDNDYEADPNKRHFYPDAEHNSDPPFHGNEKQAAGSNYVFGLAREAYEADGRRIINLTPTDKTPALEMGRLEDWA